MELKIEKVSKVFTSKKDTNVVLRDISFTVNEGQFVTLLGPSGCGKTTLLTIVAGFQGATAGGVLLNGVKVAKPGPERGFVFQNYALFPWMTVKENVIYPMKQARVPREEREVRLKELLAMAQLEGKENLYPNQLSGGMKQRIAFVRALAGNPEVLLMDEPLGAVDLQMREILQEQLESLWIKDKKTVLMVTHDVDEAVYLSDRVIVMSSFEGKILEDISIKLTRSRDRKDERFQAYKEHLSDILKSARVKQPPMQKIERKKPA